MQLINTATAAQIAKIHILKDEMRMNQGDYRSFLKGNFNVESSKKLSVAQASKAIELLIKGSASVNAATDAQRARIKKLKNEVWTVNTEEKFKEFIKKNIGFDVGIMQLKKSEASTIIYKLEKVKKWKIEKNS